MIDALLKARLAALGSEAEQRAVVQRVLNALGLVEPPEVRRVEWAGQSRALYAWGDVVLVGGELLAWSDLEEPSPGALRRREAPVEPSAPPEPPPSTILALITPDNRQRVQEALDEFAAVFFKAA